MRAAYLQGERTFQMSSRYACDCFSVSAVLEVDAFFVVIIFRDLVGLLHCVECTLPHKGNCELRVLCPESQSPLVGGQLFYPLLRDRTSAYAKM